MDFHISFELDEGFNEVIKSRFRDTFSYDSFSEGEKARINIALLMTWRSIAKMKNSTNTNLLILDEILDSSTDNTGVENMMVVFDQLKDTNLFVISHKETMADKFDATISFSKRKNFSVMV